MSLLCYVEHAILLAELYCEEQQLEVGWKDGKEKMSEAPKRRRVFSLNNSTFVGTVL